MTCSDYFFIFLLVPHFTVRKTYIIDTFLAEKSEGLLDTLYFHDNYDKKRQIVFCLWVNNVHNHFHGTKVAILMPVMSI